MCGRCEPEELGAGRHFILAPAPADSRHRRVAAVRNAPEKRHPIPHNCQVHDFVSVLLNFPIVLGSHKAKPSEWARLPSAEALHLRRLRENLFAVLGEQDFPGYRNPKGGAAEAEERVAAGRRHCPEAVTEQTAGYRTADALWTKVPIAVRVEESRQHRVLLRAQRPSTKRAAPMDVRRLLKLSAIVISLECGRISRRVPGAKASHSGRKRGIASICRHDCRGSHPCGPTS